MNPVAVAGTEADDAASEEAILAAVGERLRDERDRAIRGAHRHGLPITAIARMMKMSDRDVAEIIAG